jgi:dTDP-4-dehydrorhamnose reductase
MKFLVTGSRGTVGKVLIKTLKEKGYETIALVHDQFDVENNDLLLNYLNKEKPDAIMHLAKGGVNMTKTLASWAYEKRKSYLFTSTYKVFSGKKVEAPFTIYDTPDGSDQLAKYKIELEKVSFEANPNSYVARLAWQITNDVEDYGILSFLKFQMDRRGEVSVSKNHYLSAMFVEDTCERLVHLIEKKMPGLYHLNASDWFSFYDIVYHIKHEMGHDWINLKEPRTLHKNEMIDNLKVEITPLSLQGVKYQYPKY